MVTRMNSDGVMTIDLMVDTVFVDGLSYDQIMLAMTLAEQSPAGDFYEFHARSESHSQTWSLVGRPKGIAKVFIENPAPFYIEIETRSKRQADKQTER